MRRGFSLYAPLVGVILLSVALIILASFISEENARIGYLRALRASYAYLLPTHSMRYDAFTAFSVAARIYFQNKPVELGEEPDISEFLDGFLRGFVIAPGGTGIKEARISWNEDDVVIQEEVKDEYVLLKVTVKHPPGPLYFITMDAGGREENLEVPIFEQGTTTIYIPYPYGKVQKIAKKIQSELAGAARAGNLAYGYCSRVLEEEGGAEEVYVLRNEKGKGGRKRLRDVLKNVVERIANRLGARISDVRIVRFITRNEVSKITYFPLSRSTLRCMVPHTHAHRIDSFGNFYILVGESEQTCAYVTSIGVEGSVEIGGEERPFNVVIPLADNPAPSPYRTRKISRFNLAGIIAPGILKSAYCCSQCKQYVDHGCNPACFSVCCERKCGASGCEIECDQECYSSCKNCLNRCKQRCDQMIEELVEKLSQMLNVRDADDLKDLDIYCPIGIRTAILCDAESGACHYRNKDGNRKG